MTCHKDAPFFLLASCPAPPELPLRVQGRKVNSSVSQVRMFVLLHVYATGFPHGHFLLIVCVLRQGYK